MMLIFNIIFCAGMMVSCQYVTATINLPKTSHLQQQVQRNEQYKVGCQKSWGSSQLAAHNENI